MARTGRRKEDGKARTMEDLVHEADAWGLVRIAVGKLDVDLPDAACEGSCDEGRVRGHPGKSFVKRQRKRSASKLRQPPTPGT